MPDPTVRMAGPADNAALVALHSLTTGGSLADDYTPHSVAARAALYEDAAVLVAEIGSSIVGVAAGARKKVWIADEPGEALYVFGIRVSPASRGRGVARALLNAVHTSFEPGPASSYALVGAANIPSLRLFTQAGYRPADATAYMAARRGSHYQSPDIAPRALADLRRHQDLQPLVLHDTVHRCRTKGGLVTELQPAAGDDSPVAIWDKDAAIGRVPLRRDDTTLFLCGGESPATYVEAIHEAFGRFPQVQRLLVVTSATNVQELLRAGLSLQRLELVLARGGPQQLTRPCYADVRD